MDKVEMSGPTRQITRHESRWRHALPEAAASFHLLPLPCFLSLGSGRDHKRERERDEDDAVDEAVERGFGVAVAAGAWLRRRGRRPAGEAAAVRGDGDEEPLLLLPPHQPRAPGQPARPIHPISHRSAIFLPIAVGLPRVELGLA